MSPGKLFFFIILSSFLMSGCIGIRYLKDDEKLLYKQKIKVSRNIDSYELEELFAQRPNRRFPFINFSPYVSLYHLGLRKYDSARLINEKNLLSAKYDSLIAHTSSQRKKNKYETRKNRIVATQVKIGMV